jgi:four helix bundle protein
MDEKRYRGSRLGITDMKAENGKMKGGRVKGDLNRRTKDFAIGIIQFYSELPKTRESQVLGDQLLRSGTSVGAHFREAQRAKSILDFISKIEGALQELEETEYWLELLAEMRLGPEQKIISLQREVQELLAIFVTMVRNTKAKAD